MKSVKILFVMIPILFIISCGEDNPLSPEVPTGRFISLSGKLSNWTHGVGKNILLVNDPGYWNSGDSIYSSSAILSDGSFNLENISDADTNLMLNHAYHQFVNDAKIENSSFYCSDSSAMVAFTRLIIFYPDDPNDKTKGTVFRRNFNNWFYYSQDSVKAGDFYTEYFYVSKDVKMSGTIEVDYNDKTWNKHWLSTLHYNLSYKKGWNQMVTRIISQSVRKEGDIEIIENVKSFSNVEPNGGRWDYEYYD